MHDVLMQTTTITQLSIHSTTAILLASSSSSSSSRRAINVPFNRLQVISETTFTPNHLAATSNPHQTATSYNTENLNDTHKNY